MAFFRVVTRANGKRYWYKEERYRVGNKVKSRSKYIGPCNLGRGAWSNRDITMSLSNASYESSRARHAARRNSHKTREIRAEIREFETRLREKDELQKLEARENARKPATEAARERYMTLREQQQAEIRSYWRTVEEDIERSNKANELWQTEQKGTATPAPSSPAPAEDEAANSSDKENGGRI